MKNEEAKFILSGYRPNGSDGQDAMFGEALRQADSDPALAEWFERSQAHDRAIADKLAQIMPPAGLREAILTGGRVSATKRALWRQPAWMAAAAAVAILLVTAAFWPKPAIAEAPLVKFAMTDVLDESKHGGKGAEEKVLQSELADSASHLGKSLPIDFARLAKTGCRTLEVEGRPVLEVCFNRGGKWFHCYIGKCSDFRELAANQGPSFVENGKVSGVSWADGVNRFVVVGTAGRDAIAQLL